jgi:hypothetical protein
MDKSKKEPPEQGAIVDVTADAVDVPCNDKVISTGNGSSVTAVALDQPEPENGIVSENEDDITDDDTDNDESSVTAVALDPFPVVLPISLKATSIVLAMTFAIAPCSRVSFLLLLSILLSSLMDV